MFGRDAYTTVPEKAAALLESLVRNRPLVDGNTRLGWLSVVVFFGLNGHTPEAPDDEAYDVVVGMASGDTSVSEAAARLAVWI